MSLSLKITGQVYDWRWKSLVQYFWFADLTGIRHPDPESTRSLYEKNCAGMAANPEYIKTVLDV